MDRNLLGYKGIKPVLMMITILILVQSFSIIFQAKWLADVLSALFAGETLSEQTGTIALFLLAFFIRQITNMLQQKVAYRFAEVTGISIRKKLMEKLFQLGPRFAQTAGTGNLVTLVLEGVSKFRTYLELILPRMISTSITPVLILAYVYYLDITAGLILTFTMPILIAFLILVGLAAKKQMNEQWESYRKLSNHFVDALRGLETLKFLGQSRAHSETIGKVSNRYRSATMKTLRVAFLSSFALDFFTSLSVASVAVSLGLRLINGNLDLYTGLLILILAPEYFLPVRMVGADYHATLNGKEAGAAMQAIIDEPVAEQTNGMATNLAWAKDSSIKLHGVGVEHEGSGRPSIDDVSIELAGMRKIGIVGESGAGKSTLIDVLGGFLRPTSGSIDVNENTYASLTSEAWQQGTTYIPQHPYIFNGTLADNVRFYHPEASIEDVEQAIEAAGLTRVVAGLPNGVNEVIGNGGRMLSGGQEQRVALARAFLSQRSVILLDEPTAHLDIETEYELKATMLDLFSDKLVFLATHRLHWMPDMDLVIVMDQGKVAEIGTHNELMASKGVYYEMVALQLEGIS
ncbi:thiol reductant ABC exporter subunit CydD [Paenibacillus sp. N1-5-1-14]|uniref:thiol reductant ABC exporter subunit CydD n=1 Tax=Paenibacillus radicibacter TaxID=2972488 RepID=UPI002158ABA8|nr:thiol reductant ABC exporter subunit CydD [Paenibacillus radicibacter]MCR8642796.1 thiol reductant ABC exporter subunit CydD [Paenibacillus radicibacter]